MFINCCGVSLDDYKYVFRNADEANKVLKDKQFTDDFKLFLDSLPSEIKDKFDLDKILLDGSILSKDEIIQKLEISTERYNQIVHDYAILTSGIEKQSDLVELYKLIDMLEKDINTRYMRVVEWYSLHFPELKCEGTVEYLNKIIEIRNRETYIGDEKIVETAKTSMGRKFSEDEIETVLDDAKNVLKDIDYKEELLELLKISFKEKYANIYALLDGNKIDLMVICKLLLITNNKLSEYPSAAIQIIGAKKAQSKFGIIYGMSFMGKSKKNQGKIARMLANKISLCIKMDVEGCKTGEYGEKFRKALLNKIESFNDGSSKKINMVDFDRKVYKKKSVNFVKKN